MARHLVGAAQVVGAEVSLAHLDVETYRTGGAGGRPVAGTGFSTTTMALSRSPPPSQVDLHQRLELVQEDTNAYGRGLIFSTRIVVAGVEGGRTGLPITFEL